MSEFTDSGEISVRGIRNFLSSYIHNLSNDNVKDLFAAMQAEDFNLPNADVVGGNSQAFIEPHKLSETYGMYANKKFIGIPGNRTILSQFSRDSTIAESLVTADKFPICDFNYNNVVAAGLLINNMFEFATDELLQGAGLFALENYNSLSEWQKVNQSTDVSLSLLPEVGLAVTVNNQNNNPGISISIDTVPGYRYQVYISAGRYHTACNPKIVVGTTLNGFDIIDSPFPSGASSNAFEFIASTTTTYIRVSSDHTGATPAGSADYLIRNIGVCEMNLRYAEIDLTAYSGKNRFIPLPKDMDFYFSNQYGNYYRTFSGEDSIEIEPEHHETLELDGKIFDLRSNGSSTEYPEYGNILSIKCVFGTIRDFFYIGDGVFVKQYFSSTYVPIHAASNGSGAETAVVSLEAKCTRFCDYGISRNQDSTYNLVDSTGAQVLSSQAKNQIFNAWQDTVDNGFFYETQFALHESSDWVTSCVARYDTTDELNKIVSSTLSRLCSYFLFQTYSTNQSGLPYSLINFTNSLGERQYNSYPHHTALPRYIVNGSSFNIAIDDRMNLDASILNTINQAKSTVESIIQDKLDFKLTVLPWIDQAAGGTLAAAGTLLSSAHGLYKPTSKTLIHNTLSIEYDNQNRSHNTGFPDTSRWVNDNFSAYVNTITAGSKDVYGITNFSNFTLFENIYDSNGYTEGSAYFRVGSSTYCVESVQSATQMKISAPAPANNSGTGYSVMPCASVAYNIPNLEALNLYEIEIKIFGLSADMRYMINIYQATQNPSDGGTMTRYGMTDFAEIHNENAQIADNVSIQNGSNSIIGVGTNFLDQLTVGETVYVGDQQSARIISSITSDTIAHVSSPFSETLSGARLFSRNLKKFSFVPFHTGMYLLEIQYFPSSVEILNGFGHMNAGDSFFSTSEDLQNDLVENDQVILGRRHYYQQSNQKYLSMPQMLTVDDFETSFWTDQDILPAGVSAGDTRHKVYVKEDPSLIYSATNPNMIENVFKYTTPANNYGIDKITTWGPRVYRNSPLLTYQYSRAKPMMGAMYLDTVDMYTANNIIVHDDKTRLYYIVVHELWHAVGMGSFLWELYNLKSTSGYPTQYFGEYTIAAYQTIVANKLAALGENVADYYIDNVPAQGSAGHIAEYAKIVNNKIQPSLQNELMTPLYDDKRAILSAVSIGLLEDLGWTVDYSLAESLNLLDMSLDTSTNSNPSNPGYDELQLELTKKKRKGCLCCRHIDCDESDN